MLIDTTLQKGSGSVSVGGGFKTTVFNGKLILESEEQSEDRAFCVKIPEPLGAYEYPYGTLVLQQAQNVYDLSKHQSFDYDKIEGNLVAHSRQVSDSIRLRGRPEKRLKKLFNETHIPLRDRDRLLVLSDEKGVVFVEGFGVAQRAEVTEKTTCGVAIILLRRNGKDATGHDDAGHGKDFD